MSKFKTVLLAAAAALAAQAVPALSAPAAKIDAPVFEQPPKGTPNMTGKWIMAKPPKRLLTIDGKEPPLNASGKAEYAKRAAALKADPKTDPITECLMHGVPRLLYSPHPFLILQTTRHVVFIHEANHTTRIVYWNDPGPESPFAIWLGNSSAKWDGKTIVIDTKDFNDLTWLDGSGLPHGENLKVQERYTLVGPKTIKGELVIEDPDFYTKPWKAAFTLTKLPGMDLPERACKFDHVM